MFFSFFLLWEDIFSHCMEHNVHEPKEKEIDGVKMLLWN